MLAEDEESGAAEPSAVRSMLDRPVAQTAEFVVASLGFWLRGLLRPWRTGSEAADAAPRLPPPFAWLVVLLFATGVGWRLLAAMIGIPSASEHSLLEDFRMAVGELSLMAITLTTLPCVLLVVLGAALQSRLLGAARPVATDRVVAAVCYAIGWQCGVVLLTFAVLIAMQLGGMEPVGRLNSELNAVLPFIASFAFAWGAMLAAPAAARRFSGSRWRRSLAALVGSALVTTPLLVGALFVLGQSIDVSAALELATQRQYQAWDGALEIDVLDARPLEGPYALGRYRLTVAYTSNAKHVLVVPRHDRLVPGESGGRGFRVAESSLDYLPDRALLIQPGVTRVAEYTLEPLPVTALATTQQSGGSLPYPVRYYARQDDGRFDGQHAKLWAPREVAAVRVTDARVAPIAK